MRNLSILLASLAVPLAHACYRVHGTIQQFTDTSTYITTYAPSISLEKDGVTACNGHYYPDGQPNPYQPNFTPGAVPTNTSFSGPWGASDCTSGYTQVDLFGINGQALVRDNRTALWLNPESLAWSQEATAEKLAGYASTYASVWNFDSGSVHC